MTHTYKYLVLLVYVQIVATGTAPDSLQNQAAQIYIASQSPKKINEHLQAHKLPEAIQTILVPSLIKKHRNYLDTCYSKQMTLSYKINTTAFLTNNTLIVGSRNTQAYAIHSTTGKVIHTFKGHTNAISALAASAISNRLLTGSNDGTMCLWDIATGQIIRIIHNFGKTITAVALSLDASYALLISSDDNRVYMWDLATDVCIKVLVGHTNTVTSAQFSTDGTQALTASYDGTVRLWDITRHKPICTMVLNINTAINAAVLSSDGRLVLLASPGDNNAYLWDTTTRQIIQIFKGHFNSILSVALSPCGNYALTGSKDRTSRLWDIYTGQTLKITYHFRFQYWSFDYRDHEVTSVAFSADGNYFASVSFGGTAYVWDVAYCAQKITLADLVEKLTAPTSWWCSLV